MFLFMERLNLFADTLVKWKNIFIVRFSHSCIQIVYVVNISFYFHILRILMLTQ